MDFCDFNDASPKVCYSLPRIETLIDATVGHEMLSFMDSFSGYNHIKMYKNDIIRYHSSPTLEYYVILLWLLILRMHEPRIKDW